MNDVLFSCVRAFPKLSRLVACMCDMSMRDFVVESPFVSLLVRPFECYLHFRLVNINNVTNQTCPLCPASRGTEWLRFRYKCETSIYAHYNLNQKPTGISYHICLALLPCHHCGKLPEG